MIFFSMNETDFATCVDDNTLHVTNDSIKMLLTWKWSNKTIWMGCGQPNESKNGQMSSPYKPQWKHHY